MVIGHPPPQSLTATNYVLVAAVCVWLPLSSSHTGRPGIVSRQLLCLCEQNAFILQRSSSSDRCLSPLHGPMSSTTSGAIGNTSSRHSGNMERGGGGRTSQTAHLHRFVSLGDRFDSQIFTFIVPAQLFLNYVQEVFTKEFIYANQHWSLKLIRSDRHIGAFLTLRNALSGMSVKLDYTFIVINREHFTRNETITEKDAVFTADLPVSGRSALIEVNDLASRNFVFDDHCFLLELHLKSSMTTFRDNLILPREFSRDMAPRHLESSYFNFGSCDWNLSIEQTDTGGTAVLLSRQSRFEHWCRIKYRVIFSSGLEQRQRSVDSGIIEHLMDIDGYGRSHSIDENVFKLANSKGQLCLEIKMISMNPMAIVELMPTSRTKNLARFYDCEKREWILESDILGKLVKFRLFYADIHNLPPHYARLVAFKVYIVPYDRNHSLIRALSSPYCCFYAQKEIDDGFEVSMNLQVEQVCDPAPGVVHPQNGSLTVQIEWVYNHLLCYDQYHHYDNISRLHKHQMSREILALQAENYALEKQVHNYQVNLSTRPDGISTVPATPTSNPGVTSLASVPAQRSASRGPPLTPQYVSETPNMGYNIQTGSPAYNPQDRLRRSLPNAPSPQHRRPAQYGDISGPSPAASGRLSHNANHSSAFSSPRRAASPVSRKSSSPATPQRGYQKQRNGRSHYDDGYSQSRSPRRVEERW